MHVMNKTKYSIIIESEVNKLLDSGLTDKQLIIQRVVENLGLPRPTIRRVIRDMRNDMMKKIKILQPDNTPLPDIPIDLDN